MISDNPNLILYFIRIIELAGLSLFTILFLELNSRNKKLKNLILISLLGLLLIGILFIVGYTLDIVLIFLYIHYIILIYSGFYTYRSGYKPAKYFLLATVIAISFVLVFTLIPLGILPMGIFTTNLIGVSLIWDMLFFSFALSYKIRVLQNEKERTIIQIAEKEKMLFHQNKLASMGEMIANIAHQWRQPLAELGSLHTGIDAKLRFDTQKITDREIKDFIYSSQNIIEHLSKTIDFFQTTLKPSIINNNNQTLITDIIDNVLLITRDTLRNYGITIKVNYKSKDKYIIQSDELLHSLLNIINNSKDIFIERKIKNPEISIITYNEYNNFNIKISDNGGGITFTPVERVFEPYITSNIKFGSGLGLFITKTLLNKLNAQIKVYNNSDGCEFIISFDNQI
jgi:signal transduction histidine kinase